MDINKLIIAIVIILFVWFLLGFIAFLISAKHDKCYVEFDDSARNDLLSFMWLGILSLIFVIAFLIVEWFCNMVDYLLRKWNKWRVYEYRRKII